MKGTSAGARVIGPFQRFFATEAAGGILLLVCAALALAWANSPWAPAYHALWEHELGFDSRAIGLSLTLHDWVNDGLMAVFFLLVGLEVKRELLIGELSSMRTAALPVAAAIGGMLVPAAIYAALNHGGVGARGWGIPMATDIAFALGILALLGEGLPAGLRILLAAIAIADDLGAVIVIAMFYTTNLVWGALGGAALVMVVLVALNLAGVSRATVYVAVGIVLWLFVLLSGVHATIAGVLLAFVIPARARTRDVPRAALLQRMEAALHAPVAFVIMPIFALANAGIALGSALATAVRSPIVLGVALGLLIGKPLGILGGSVTVVRCGAADLPAGVTWRHMHGMAWLGGIGFTMSLFIAGLAFSNAGQLETAKVGVLGASTLAGVSGFAILRRTIVKRSASDGNGDAETR